MRRRAFHRSLLALLAGGSLFVFASSRRARAPGNDSIGQFFFYLPDRRAVVALGRLAIMAGHRPAPRLEFGSEVYRTIAADFSAGRIVTVDGWVISETEARIAAAVAAKG